MVLVRVCENTALTAQRNVSVRISAFEKIMASCVRAGLFEQQVTRGACGMVGQNTAQRSVVTVPTTHRKDGDERAVHCTHVPALPSWLRV